MGVRTIPTEPARATNTPIGLLVGESTARAWTGSLFETRVKRKKKQKLPSGTVPRPQAYVFPPDVFWISPKGVVIEVIGHLTAIQQRPEAFDLVRAPKTRRQIDDAFRELLQAGWVRGRHSTGVFHFQLYRPRGDALGHAHDLVAKYAQHAAFVEVDFTGPWKYETFTLREFLDQKFPTAWGINPRNVSNRRRA